MNFSFINIVLEVTIYPLDEVQTGAHNDKLKRSCLLMQKGQNTGVVFFAYFI